MTREEIENSKAYQVSKEALKYYNEHYKDKDIDLMDAFEAGAEWADEHPTPCSVRMVGSQSYSKQQLREMGFAFDLNGNVLSPNELASKAAHYVIEKACDWLLKGGYFVNNTETINDFKKAMGL